MTRSSMRRTKKIRASKDEQLQEDTLPLTQRPGFIIGMTFLGVFVAFIISVLIFRFISRDKKSRTLVPQGETDDVNEIEMDQFINTSRLQEGKDKADEGVSIFTNSPERQQELREATEYKTKTLAGTIGLSYQKGV